MSQSVFFEMEFFLLIIFSFVIPIAIYEFLARKKSISRITVLCFALFLVVVAGIDVVLLQMISERAKETVSAIDDKVFSQQTSIALYLLPAVFAGVGVNLVSHVLINHLNGAEEQLENSPREASKYNLTQMWDWFLGWRIPKIHSEIIILVGSLLVIVGIFLLDVLAGTKIHLHVLYIFLLAIVARYCNSIWSSAVALVTTIVLQIITFSLQAITLLSFAANVFVALAASLLIVFLARVGRKSYLQALYQAITDPLTNLSNRRAFISELDAEIARQKRYGGTISLAVLDLDGFKILNDSKGHHAGDQALKLTANILQHFLRQTDVVARIGGDEFAILMPNTRKDDCRYMCNKIHALIAEQMANVGFNITASVGCKTFRTAPRSSADALQQADEMMYAVKRRHKNTTIYAIPKYGRGMYAFKKG